MFFLECNYPGLPFSNKEITNYSFNGTGSGVICVKLCFIAQFSSFLAFKEVLSEHPRMNLYNKLVQCALYKLSLLDAVLVKPEVTLLTGCDQT